MNDGITDEEAIELLRAPVAVEQLAGGGTRVTKAGMVGVGATPEEAAADLAEKLAVAYTRPALPRDEP